MIYSKYSGGALHHKMKKRLNKKTAGMALSQILTLLIGVVAVCYAIASGIGFVSADDASTAALSKAMIDSYLNPAGSAQAAKAGASVAQAASSTAASTAAPAAASYVPTDLPSGLLSADSLPVDSGLPPFDSVPSGLAPGAGSIPLSSTTPTALGSTLSSQSTAAEGAGYESTAELPTVAQGAAATPAKLTLFGGGTWAFLAEAVVASVAVYFLVGWLKYALALPPGSTADDLLGAAQVGLAAGAGTFIYLAQAVSLSSGLIWGGAITIAVAIGYLFFTSDQKQDEVVFQCSVWQPPLGGSDCSKCGESGLPCSGYECASLGTSCVLLNDGNYGQPICTANLSTSQPVINFLPSALTAGYNYQPISGSSYPGTSGDTGVSITPSVPPYSILDLGITTDQPAECYLSLVRGANYSEMASTGAQLGTDGGINGDENLWGARNPDGTFNHTFAVPVFKGDAETALGISVQQAGQIDYYVRCRDTSGNNPDIGAYVIQFDVNQIPNSTPPVIEKTIPLSGTPISYGVYTTNVTIFTNEPDSQCRWSHTDQSFQNMGYNLTTYGGPDEYGLFSAVANLTGIINGQTNNFYFRCNDTQGDVDATSTPFNLVSSNSELSIISATPNQTTILSASDDIEVPLAVQTSGGYDGAGTASCFYYIAPSTTTVPTDDLYQAFDNTGSSSQSSANLYLTPGQYLVYLKCVDMAGDADYSWISFNVQQDNTPPNVVRAYHDTDSNTLDIQTDQNATCSYDTVSCNQFSAGTLMTTYDNITQSAPWIPDQTYYITCENQFGITPAPNVCSITLSPSNF